MEIWKLQKDGTFILANSEIARRHLKTDINKYTDITDVKVKEIVNGERKEFNEISRYMYHVNKDNYYGLINDDGDFEIAWGVGLDNDSDRRVYEISYTVEGGNRKIYRL